MDFEAIEAAGFAPVTSEDWRALAEKALRGADFDDALTTCTGDGLSYGPVYPRRQNAAIIARADTSRPWRIAQRIDDPDPARARGQIEDELANGANALSLAGSGAALAYGFGTPVTKPSLEALLGGLDLSDVAVRVDGEISSDAAQWVGEQKTAALHLGGDTVDGRPAHNAGATEAQELAVILAGLAEALRIADKAGGIDADTALARTTFAVSVDQNQFLSTAKLRALRLLHAAMLDACGIERRPAIIHAETSLRMLTWADAETNILRNTIAAFAAGTGGADAICVLPHTLAHGLPDASARRIARNTQHVLISEAHLDHVADPAAGSGGLEALTDELAEKAWAEFQTIEAEGGLAASIADGKITQRIAKARDHRVKAIAAKDLPIIGTTLYPAAQERPVNVLAERDSGPLASGFGDLPAIFLHEAVSGGVQ